MNDLLRPSLYDAWHDIVPVTRQRRATQIYDVVGPVCESSDIFARDRELPRCEPDDLLMIKTTGAYGASMASTYNSRPMPAEVLLDEGRYAVVQRRQTFDDMIAGEQPARDWESA
jgi:diaminopimelate decarboxylase